MYVLHGNWRAAKHHVWVKEETQKQLELQSELSSRHHPPPPPPDEELSSHTQTSEAGRNLQGPVLRFIPSCGPTHWGSSTDMKSFRSRSGPEHRQGGPSGSGYQLGSESEAVPAAVCSIREAVRRPLTHLSRCRKAPPLWAQHAGHWCGLWSGSELVWVSGTVIKPHPETWPAHEQWSSNRWARCTWEWKWIPECCYLLSSLPIG